MYCRRLNLQVPVAISVKTGQTADAFHAICGITMHPYVKRGYRPDRSADVPHACRAEILLSLEVSSEACHPRRIYAPTSCFQCLWEVFQQGLFSQGPLEGNGYGGFWVAVHSRANCNDWALSDAKIGLVGTDHNSVKFKGAWLTQRLP